MATPLRAQEDVWRSRDEERAAATDGVNDAYVGAPVPLNDVAAAAKRATDEGGAPVAVVGRADTFDVREREVLRPGHQSASHWLHMPSGPASF